VATNPHVAITTHITLQELHARLDRVEIFNGFANRFLWLCVRRTSLSPSGTLGQSAGAGVSKEALFIAGVLKAVFADGF